MAMARTMGWGLVGSATTMLARNVTRRAMHDRSGTIRLPWTARRDNSFAMMLAIAAAAGALLALGDVLKEQRKYVTHAS